MGAEHAMHRMRIRLAVCLVSGAAIAFELVLMRLLAIRFWHHFAYWIISIALLGFAASATVISIMRRRPGRLQPRLYYLSLLLGCSIPLSVRLADLVALDPYFLGWNFGGELMHVLLLEVALCVPFLVTGALVGLALTDSADAVGGHYAANLIGSGLGAVGAVCAMGVVGVVSLTSILSFIPYAAGLLLVERQTTRSARWIAAGAGAFLGLSALLAPRDPTMAACKMLSVLRNVPETKALCRREGPLGRLDAVAGPHIHHAPGLSLRYTGAVPSHVLLLLDGEVCGAVYDCREPDDWAFMNATTSAVAYDLLDRPQVLIIGAGGGADIGLAAYRDSRHTTALEMNRQLIETMTGVLAGHGGRVYTRPDVEVLPREARGFLAGSGKSFDLIQLAAVDAFGASGAGLYASQESHLYTVEAVDDMLSRLSDQGLLCITRWVRTPPRDGLKALDLVASALRQRGLPPGRHMAVIRSWITVTILAQLEPFSPQQNDLIREFCEQRSFDVCWLSDLDATEANQYHILEGPHYYDAACRLLGEGRDAFLREYLYDVRAPSDDKPFYYHFFRWSGLAVLRGELGNSSAAFLELGFILVMAALLQSGALSVPLILVPLYTGIPRQRRYSRTTLAAALYFLALGVGFMFVEMGFLQRLVWYLSHPIYAAATVISAFLVFAGIGSEFGSRRHATPRRAIPTAAATVAALALLYCGLADPVLGATQSWPLPVRFLCAGLAIAPLAFAMGHLFPAGLRVLARHSPEHVPFAWGVNGCASVVAAVAAPVVAMQIGFSGVILCAVAAYLAAAVVARCWLAPNVQENARASRSTRGPHRPVERTSAERAGLRRLSGP